MFHYTTAPEAYDGFGTKTIEVVGDWVSKSNGQRKPVRKVQIDPEHFNWQSMRYSSGMHPTWTEEQFQEEKRYGYIGGHHVD